MSETHWIQIVLVGTVTDPTDFSMQLSDLFARLVQILPETMPDFTPANPPAIVNTAALLGPPTNRRVDLQLSDTESRLIDAAARLVETLRGDGNGRVWCDARASDALRAAVEGWTRQ